MSNVSSIYDAIITRIQAVLPTAQRLSNPFVLEENDVLVLKNGFGLKMGSGRNTRRLVLPKLSIERVFTVVLTRQIYALDTNPSGKAATEKQLLEDQVSLIKDIENDPTIGQVTMKAVYDTDTGVNFLSSNDEQFYGTEIEYRIEYFEDLT
jgi:hypothetical protein